jgi:hypothetical protein
MEQIGTEISRWLALNDAADDVYSGGASVGAVGDAGDAGADAADNTYASTLPASDSQAPLPTTAPTLKEQPFAEWKQLLREYFHVDRAWYGARLCIMDSSHCV